MGPASQKLQEQHPHTHLTETNFFSWGNLPVGSRDEIMLVKGVAETNRLCLNLLSQLCSPVPFKSVALHLPYLARTLTGRRLAEEILGDMAELSPFF